MEQRINTITTLSASIFLSKAEKFFMLTQKYTVLLRYMPRIKENKKQSKSDLSRLRLIKSAIKVFSKKGFEGGSFEEIAKLAKLSSTAPFYYFKSKESLMEEIQTYISSHSTEFVNEYLSGSQNAISRLRSHFRGNLSWALENQDEVHLTLFMYYQSCFNKKWAKINLDVLTIARQKIKNILQEGEENNELQLSLDLNITTELLHDALLGSLVNLVTTKSVDSKAAHHIEKKWESLFKKILIEK